MTEREPATLWAEIEALKRPGVRRFELGRRFLELRQKYSERERKSGGDTLETSGGYHQRIVFKPANLLAAMWIQFAQAVTEEFQLRQCPCGKYFQVGPGGKRADAAFHNDLCRVKYWVDQKNREKTASKKRRQ